MSSKVPVQVGKWTIELTHKPAAALQRLVAANGEPVRVEELCPLTADPSDSAKVMVSRQLRPALHRAGVGSIETVRHMGYKLIIRT